MKQTHRETSHLQSFPSAAEEHDLPCSTKAHMSVEAFEPFRPSCREGNNQDLFCARRAIWRPWRTKRRGALDLAFRIISYFFGADFGRSVTLLWPGMRANGRSSPASSCADLSFKQSLAVDILAILIEVRWT
jgi:hypothetical protein